MPSYRDISAVYFRSEGITEPVAIHGGEPIRLGACPVEVVLYVSPTEVDKGGGPYCFSRARKVYSCCAAVEFSTDDAPQLIFNRLVAVLEKDHFYDIVELSHPAQSDSAGFYSIAVMRCGAQPHNKNLRIVFLAAPQAQYNTSILALSIPFGSLPEFSYDSKIITLFDDFTHTIYQSQWNTGDIY